MRIAFLTDLHLDAEGVLPQGIDVRKNFCAALAYLSKQKPDGLVIGGDVCCETPDRAVYAWVREQLDQLPFPYYAIAGNHDDSVMMAEVFDLTHHLQGTELYYALPLEGRPTLFLDTAKGRLSPAQWTWLREYLTVLRDNNLLVFMHHPPLPADVQFMDTHYPFEQPDEFLALMRDMPCHVIVVCGHYHVEKIVQRGNLLTLLSPSTFYQMQQDTPAFAYDHFRVGIREINLTTHGTNSTVHYLP